MIRSLQYTLLILFILSSYILSMEEQTSSDLPKKVLDSWFRNYWNVDLKEDLVKLGLDEFYQKELANFQKYENNILSLKDNPTASAMGGIN